MWFRVRVLVKESGVDEKRESQKMKRCAVTWFCRGGVLRSAGVCLLLVGVVAVPFGLSQGVPMGMRRSTLQMSSHDGAVVIRAPFASRNYRGPVLIFVDRTREELMRATHLKLGSPLCPLEVVLGERQEQDKRVLSSRVVSPEGSVNERIELPNPETADLEAFRRAVCIALLRAWMVTEGGREGEMQDVPLWLINGVVRYTGRETRQADIDRTLALWSRACLPPAIALFAAESVATTQEPEVTAVLASWFLEKRPEGNPFEILLRKAAKGEKWRPEMGALLLTGTSDATAFDSALDRWLVGLRGTVVKPGLTTVGILRRFRSLLLLYPAFYGTTFGNNQSSITFQEAVMCADSLEVRQRAVIQASWVELGAVGRDGMLLAVAEAYAAFLRGLSAGETKGTLSKMLLEAEAMRRDLELRSERGVLRQRNANEAGAPK